MSTTIPVIDGHNDLPFALREKTGYSVDGLSEVRHDLHTDLVRLRRGGVGGQFWSVWVPSSIPQSEAVTATLEQIDAVIRLVRAYPRDLELVTDAEGLEAALGSGRIASLIGMEGGQSIANSLAVLRQMYRLGARYMTLTHNDDLDWATSATGLRERQAEAEGLEGPPAGRSRTGLNADGQAVVREMNRLGMLVDLSHTNERTQLDALAVSSAPAFFSHSSVQAVNPHPRNVTDRVLGRIVETSGVLCLTFVPAFVSRAQSDWYEHRAEVRVELGIDERDAPAVVTRPYAMPASPRPAQDRASTAVHNAEHLEAEPGWGDTGDEDPALYQRLLAWEEDHPRPDATIDDVVEHIDHAREAMGVEHVGLGGDYDGTDVLPHGLADVGHYQDLLGALQARGWSLNELEALASGNLVRVMRDTEDAAEN